MCRRKAQSHHRRRFIVHLFTSKFLTFCVCFCLSEKDDFPSATKVALHCYYKNTDAEMSRTLLIACRAEE